MSFASGLTVDCAAPKIHAWKPNPPSVIPPEVNSGLNFSSSATDLPLSGSGNIPARIFLAQCQWESPERSWGSCDGGFPCYDRATVHDLVSDLDFCLKHFLEAQC